MFLSGRLDGAPPACHAPSCAAPDLRILTRTMFHLTSSLVNSRPVWNVDALAQVELDLLEVAADVPALGEHRLRLELRVVLREGVVDGPDGVERGRADAVRVDAARPEIGRRGDAQDAAGLRLGRTGGGLGGLSRLRGFGGLAASVGLAGAAAGAAAAGALVAAGAAGLAGSAGFAGSALGRRARRLRRTGRQHGQPGAARGRAGGCAGASDDRVGRAPDRPPGPIRHGVRTGAWVASFGAVSPPWRARRLVDGHRAAVVQHGLSRAARSRPAARPGRIGARART